jgi:hypothetical protein
MADLARIEKADLHSGTRIDPAERAVLIGLYRELVGTIDGRVVPFPVELMDDPALVPDRIRPADVVDLAAARARRSVPPGEAVPQDGDDLPDDATFLGDAAILGDAAFLGETAFPDPADGPGSSDASGEADQD